MMRSSLTTWQPPDSRREQLSIREILAALEISEISRSWLEQNGHVKPSMDTIGLRYYKPPEGNESADTTARIVSSGGRPSLEYYQINSQGLPVNPYEHNLPNSGTEKLWAGPSQAVDALPFVELGGVPHIIMVWRRDTRKWATIGGFIEELRKLLLNLDDHPEVSYLESANDSDPDIERDGQKRAALATWIELLQEAIDAPPQSQQQLFELISSSPIFCQIYCRGENRNTANRWVETTAFVFEIPAVIFSQVKLRQVDTEASQEEGGGVERARPVSIFDILRTGPSSVHSEHQYHMIMAAAKPYLEKMLAETGI